MGVAMILEYPEETIEPDVNTGGLNHPRIKWFDGNPFGSEFGFYVAIGKQHPRRVPIPSGARWVDLGAET